MAQLQACKWCGSRELVWSHETGYIVCGRCGAVLEPIVDDHAPPPMRPRARRPLPRYRDPAEELVEKAARRGLLVRRTRRGLVLEHPGNEAARRMLRDAEVRMVYEEIERDPILRARTLRAKVGLATYLSLLASGMSKRRAMIHASQLAGTSPYTIRAIVRKYRSRVEEISMRIWNEGDSGSEGSG